MIACKGCKHLETDDWDCHECKHDVCFTTVFSPYHGENVRGKRIKGYKQLNKDGKCKYFEYKPLIDEIFSDDDIFSTPLSMRLMFCLGVIAIIGFVMIAMC